jgi:dUTP pyrophosphatase
MNSKLEFLWVGANVPHEHYVPVRKTTLASGLDLKAYVEKPTIIAPNTHQLIRTGWKVKIPAGYELQIRTRSGMAYKHGITVLNCPGTIDADYQGELKIILANTSNTEFIVLDGMTVAQLVMCPVVYPDVHVIETGSLFDATSMRGTGGFGSTGEY